MEKSLGRAFRTDRENRDRDAHQPPSRRPPGVAPDGDTEARPVADLWFVTDIESHKVDSSSWNRR